MDSRNSRRKSLYLWLLFFSGAESYLYKTKILGVVITLLWMLYLAFSGPEPAFHDFNPKQLLQEKGRFVFFTRKPFFPLQKFMMG